MDELPPSFTKCSAQPPNQRMIGSARLPIGIKTRRTLLPSSACFWYVSLHSQPVAFGRRYQALPVSRSFTHWPLRLKETGSHPTQQTWLDFRATACSPRLSCGSPRRVPFIRVQGDLPCRSTSKSGIFLWTVRRDHTLGLFGLLDCHRQYRFITAGYSPALLIVVGVKGGLAIGLLSATFVMVALAVSTSW